jgi:hypothetical protein
MEINLNILQQINPNSLWLTFSETEIKQARSILDQYSNQTAKNQALVNYLVQICLTNWFQDNLDCLVKNFPENYQHFWEFINGFCLQIEDKKIVIIPSQDIDIEGLTIEQEWVDIPDLAADFYLAVQVDLAEKFLNVWGFISQEDVKNLAEYDSIYHQYYVDSEKMLDNLYILWESCREGESEKGMSEDLPILSVATAEGLLKKLSQISPYSPRLDVSFEQWGALLNNPQWRDKLYQQRLEITTTKLSQWLQGIITEKWQEIVNTGQHIINRSLDNYPSFNPAFLSSNNQAINLESVIDIQRGIRQLYASQKEVKFSDNLTPQEALAKLQHQTQDETIRWQAAEYLWNIDPHYPNSAIRKMLDVGSQLMGYKIALMVGVLATNVQRMAVLIRVYSLDNFAKLPPSLSLQITDEIGEVIPGLEVIARKKPLDSYIQLYFLADSEDRFNVKLCLEDSSITEQFKI